MRKILYGIYCIWWTAKAVHDYDHERNQIHDLQIPWGSFEVKLLLHSSPLVITSKIMGARIYESLGIRAMRRQCGATNLQFFTFFSRGNVSRHASPRHSTPTHATPCHPTRLHATEHHFKPPNATPCQTVAHHATQYRTMPPIATPCHLPHPHPSPRDSLSSEFDGGSPTGISTFLS